MKYVYLISCLVCVFVPFSDGEWMMRNEANFASAFKEREHEMHKVFDSPLIHDLIEKERSYPLTAETLMTEERFAMKVLEDSDTIYSQLEGEVLARCLADIGTYLGNLSDGASYAWQMRTSGGSFGRLATIAYTWRLEYPGIYELCIDTKKKHPEAPFETIYCTEHLPLDDNIFVSKGRCLPASCTDEDLYIIFNTIFAVIGLEFWIGSFYTCIRDVPWEWDAIFVACLLGVFGLIVALGTFYDIAYRRRRLCAASTSIELQTKTPKSEEKNDDVESNEKLDANGGSDVPMKHQSKQQLYMTSEEETELETNQTETKVQTPRPSVGRLETLISSCSAIYTADKILSAKKSASSLACLNGIRVLSMFWIIWGHCNNFIIYQRLDNLKYLVEDVVNRYWFNSTLFASYSVDTFFVLSGLLVTYLTLKELQARNGKMNWPLYYIHRFWRLTPAYMMTIAFFTSLKVHIGTGADKVEIAGYESEPCREYWWTNLLYINNLYPFPGILGGCAGWSWYLANDMQFFIISPLFILLLFHRKTSKVGVVSVWLVCLASCIVTAFLTGYYGVPLGKSITYYNDRLAELEPDGSNSDIIYGKPYCRIQSYMVGMFVGYMLYRHFHMKKINMHWMTCTVSWFFAIGIMYTLLYALHPTGGREEPLPQWFSAVWGGVCRTLWSMGVAWVAFACCTGRGGLINSFLSWSFWTPMARLTYGAYLLHPIIIFGFLRTKKILFHWTYPEMVMFTCGSVVLSYIAALLLSIFIEGPTMGLEKAILRKKK
ncbi:O-acyltransferase like protein-like [Apostichopus japonicus]|uniref:O-acyltransferase like protein-like n=1 Tax=Stichopus japonicus TaxID=307972 RepID=UPI003AB7E708